MNPLLLIAAFGSRPKVLQTVTFNSNTTWPCPADVALLSAVVGHGTNGVGSTPGTPDTVTPGAKKTHYETIYTRKDGTQEYVDGGYGTWTDPKPANTHTTTYIGDFSTVYNFRDDYVTYTQDPDTVTPGTPGTAGSSGADATGFGKTFAGGTPSAPTAATTSYPNVAVTPGSSNTIVVPAGATIQITYYQ